MRSSIVHKIKQIGIRKQTLKREYNKNRENMLETILSSLKPGTEFARTRKNTLASDKQRKLSLEEGLRQLRKQSRLISDEVKDVVNTSKIVVTQNWCQKSIDIHGIINFFK